MRTTSRQIERTRGYCTRYLINPILGILCIGSTVAFASVAQAQEVDPGHHPATPPKTTPATVPAGKSAGQSPPLTVPESQLRKFDTRSTCLPRPAARTQSPSAIDETSRTRAVAAIAQIPESLRQEVPTGVGIPASSRESTFVLPRTTTEPMLLSGPSGDVFGVRLLGARSIGAASLDSFSSVHPTTFPGTDVIFQRSEAGSARTLIVLNDATAPQEFHFEFGAVCVAGNKQSESQVQLTVTETGAVTIDLATGPEVHGLGTISPPWAVDATGRAVKTTFEARGSTLIQRIGSAGATFPIVADPTYSTNTCPAYLSDGTASDYVLGHYCPVYAMFRSIRPYNAVLMFETNVARDYGLVAGRQDGGCSPPATNTGPSWDFQVPCKAHDYCYDLVRAGLGNVRKADCDQLFLNLMLAHCKYRTEAFACESVARLYFAGVDQVSTLPLPPRKYAFIAQHSGKCADVFQASQQPGAPIQQYDCHYQTNQQFRIAYTGASPVDYSVEPVHSGQCMDVRNFGLQSEIQQYSCFTPRPANQLYWIRGFGDQNQYTFRPRSSAGWGDCLDVPGSSTANEIGLIRYPCTENSNQRWAIVYIP
jgi:hypothetical protein